MAGMKIAVDCRNLHDILQAFVQADPHAVLELHRYFQDGSNPAQQLLQEYQAYQALVDAQPLGGWS